MPKHALMRSRASQICLEIIRRLFERQRVSAVSKQIEKHREPAGQAWAGIFFGSVSFGHAKEMNAPAAAVYIKLGHQSEIVSLIKLAKTLSLISMLFI